MLREVTTDLWAIETPFELLGMKMGVRMTVVRRLNGDLFVYAPFAVTDEDEAAIRDKGEVRDIVAPNPGHYTEVSDFAKRFPDATLWVISDIAKKVADVPHKILEEAPESWKEDFDSILFDGTPLFREWAFCHRASKSLLITDLAFHLPRPETPLNRIAARLNDVGRRFGVSRAWRTGLKLGNKNRNRECVQTILGWDFERIVPGHGFVVEKNAKEQFRSAYRFLKV
ncbi:DUF4336 domain-containing protein [bacterium]|nr:MAG: DUF4336 domain-containing protein [bacterium]